MNKRVWVNFKELRSKLRFEEVLKHFKVEMNRKGDQHQGFCPIPGHGGNRRSPSFSVNLEKGIFQCFGCGAKGNVLEFAALMSGVDPSDGIALRSIAVELQRQFFPDGANSRTKPNLVGATASAPLIKTNEPLDFELKDLDATHPYIVKRGFTPEVANHFKIGVCSRGLLKGRLAIPLHDPKGRLVGYAGRMLDDQPMTAANPKYRFPSRRELGGIIYEFRKMLFLYNGHRLKLGTDDLIVVEGFASVWWLTQSGFPRAVATMGSECSEEQASLILSIAGPTARVWVMPDGDRSGELLAESIFNRISPYRFVRWAKLDDGKQPTGLLGGELKALLTE